MEEGRGGWAGGEDVGSTGGRASGKKKKKAHPKESQLLSPDSSTLGQTLMCPFKETRIFLIPSLIKITYIKECVSLRQGFHLLYNEVNAETQWLPLQCKWRPNDNLHYLNKVIAITLRYSNEDRRFEPSTLNSLLRLQKIWKPRRRTDSVPCASSNWMWCKPRAMSKAKSLRGMVRDGRGQLQETIKVAWPTDVAYWWKFIYLLMNSDRIWGQSKKIYKNIQHGVLV